MRVEALWHQTSALSFAHYNQRHERDAILSTLCADLCSILRTSLPVRGCRYYFTAEGMQALRVRFASQLSDYSSCAVPITPTQGAPPCVLAPCYTPPVKLGSGRIPLPGPWFYPFTPSPPPRPPSSIRLHYLRPQDTPP